MAARVGSSATISRQPRQARKGATVPVILGAGGVLARAVASFRVDAASIGPRRLLSSGVGPRDLASLLPPALSQAGRSCKVRHLLACRASDPGLPTRQLTSPCRI